jgi:tetratricopeptide (TPR) repeat protein
MAETPKLTIVELENKGSPLQLPTPDWIKNYLANGIMGVQSQPQFKDKYCIIGEEFGTDKQAVFASADNFNPQMRLRAMLGAAIAGEYQARAAGAASNDYNRQIDNVINAITNVIYNGVQREADWWILRRRYDPGQQDVYIDEYWACVLHTIPKPELNRQVARALEASVSRDSALYNITIALAQDIYNGGVDLSGIGIKLKGTVFAERPKSAEQYLAAAEQGNAEAQFNLGLCYENGWGIGKDIEKAMEWYTKSAQQGYVAGYYARGNVYQYAKQDYDRAIADYTEAIRLNPNDAFAFCARGNAYYTGKKDYDRAIADYSEAVRFKPNFDLAYFNRGNAYQNGKQDYDRAIADYTEALRHNPNYASAYNNRGYAYQNGKKDYDRAIADYTEAVRLNPNHAGAYYGRGDAYCYGKKDYDRAITDYTEVLRLNSNNAFAYYDRGNVYCYGKKDYARAIADYTEAVKINPNYALAYNNRGLTYLNGEKNYDLAVADFETAAKLDPANTLYRENIKKAKDAKRSHGWEKIKNGFYIAAGAAIIGYLIFIFTGPDVKQLKPLEPSLTTETGAAFLYRSVYKITEIDGSKVTGFSTGRAKSASVLMPPGEHTISFDYNDGDLKADGFRLNCNMKTGITYVIKSIIRTESGKKRITVRIEELPGDGLKNYLKTDYRMYEK